MINGFSTELFMEAVECATERCALRGTRSKVAWAKRSSSRRYRRRRQGKRSGACLGLLLRSSQAAAQTSQCRGVIATGAELSEQERRTRS